MDWKQNEKVDVICTPAMHEGEGPVRAVDSCGTAPSCR